MSGGSFNYLCHAEDPGQRSELDDMIIELATLGERHPAAAEAAAESRIVRAEGLSRLSDARDWPPQPLRSVWHAIEWWRSYDWGEDEVVEALTRYSAERDRVRSISVVYRNHRGDVANRRIRPFRVRYGETQWHPRPQWLLECWDVEKNAARTFALKDCDFDGADW